MNSHVFISHSSKDDAFVAELRRALEGQGLAAWADSRELRGGDELAPEVERNIEEARHFIAVLSPHAVNSPWVRREIRKALEVKARRGDAYRVVPLLLPGIEPPALGMWFEKEPVAVSVETGPGRLAAALPALLAALGERLPDERRPPRPVASRPVAELRLELTDARVETGGGKRRAAATASLIYEPPDAAARDVRSRRFTFTAPLGPIEAEDLRWYLESYHLWPTGVFAERAERIEEQLPRWGQGLFEAALGTPAARAARDAWRHAPEGAERRFTVLVDSDPPEGSSQEALAAARAAASELLSLPWELLHDEDGYLFQGKSAARVRRTLPNRREQSVKVTGLPVRILLASPRPEDARAGDIDHRASALPLVEALETLGELATLTVLTPPTFPELARVLREADERGEPFDVVHFDGHGLFDREHGLGGLCFEDPRDAQKLEGRATQIVNAEQLGRVVRDYRVPLVFLEACESARTEENPTASVAARLLEEGVTSVVAMSHGVLVETARRFVKAFYERLARGARVGTAMLAGQLALQEDAYRGRIMGAGELRLQDWFVPVLYQEEHDPQLITELPADAVRELQARSRRRDFGGVPDPPPHHFQGRSRELLKLERLLRDHPYGVVRGQGGAGKTTLAAELARWLVRTNRHERAAFVSLEHYSDARAVLDSLGRQLLPGDYSVAQFTDLAQAFQPVRRALSNDPTIIVLDNMESVLPDRSGRTPSAAAPVEELFELCRDLLDSSPSTRLLFTTREPMPEPFDHPQREVVLGPLSRDAAVALVSHVMAQARLTPAPSDPGSTPDEITELVEAADRHARALVLLAPEVARRGVRATTDSVREIMADLHRRHPDDRERSLYASLELSLRRLPPETRAQLKALAPFHGGAHLGVLSQVLGAGPEATRHLASCLVAVGLAAETDFGHLRLDPALPSYLLADMAEAELEEVRVRWAKATGGLVTSLYRQRNGQPEEVARLMTLELPNVLAMLEYVSDKAAPEAVTQLASCVETMLAHMGRPRALARATKVREQAARALGGWSHARCMAVSTEVDRLLESGNLRAALDAAQRLLAQCSEAGEKAYRDADYDLAMAYLRVGRALEKVGAAEAALAPLGEGQQRLQVLADAGHRPAAQMVAAALSERGSCLLALGRDDEAAAHYRRSIAIAESLSDNRHIAVGKSQLAAVLMKQRRFDEALQIQVEVRDIFESLDEPGNVGRCWRQIGMTHQAAGRLEQAEEAYRQALAIKVQRQMVEEEALTLYDLGGLYFEMGRLEDSVTFYRQAADVYARRQNANREGIVRTAMARSLAALRLNDEARRELYRALECKKPFGHSSKIWLTWGQLSALETDAGDPSAAAAAWRQAAEAYLAYRRSGGESRTRGMASCGLIAQAFAQGKTAEAEALLARAPEPDGPPWPEALIPKLMAVLKGVRDLRLADDPAALSYDDAVELRLLLEYLSAMESRGGP
ncbi:MAG TPA: TIR domain-containing protein [Pyrinomonadaceae bacterium]|nr:TIR domain-containing protein [Pyrinomonadaceae bacterium]